MSLRLNMAGNLQRLVSGIGSANLVSRELGINRQQFEKYLKGRSLPSRATLTRLCSYFKITEEALFSQPQESESQFPLDEPSIHGSCEEVLRPLFSEPAASIKPGIYYIWLTVPRSPGQVVCAPVFIERRDDAVTFRRVTGSAEPKDRFWWHRVGDHKGTVVERLSWLIFVGVNQRGNHEPSMLRLKWVPLSTAVLGGHATIFTPTGISFAAACMRPAPPGTTFRQAMRQSRQYDISDATVDSITRMVLDQQRQELREVIERDLSQ